MRFKMNVLAPFATTLLVATMAAQTTLESAQLVTNGPPGAGQPGMVTMHVERMDAPVKGAPYCASVLTEHTQVFADGNRIHTSDNSTMCRDSEGRTRSEADLVMLGTAAQKSPAKLITIVDPVAGFRYTLDPNQQIARRAPIGSGPGAMSDDGARVKIGYMAKERVSGSAAYAGGAMFFSRRWYKIQMSLRRQQKTSAIRLSRVFTLPARVSLRPFPPEKWGTNSQW